MDAHRREFEVVIMARVLRVSRSGFYRWCRGQGPSPRARVRAELDARVKALFEAHKARYGAPRLTRELHDQGLPCDEKTGASSLRRQGLVARAARRFKATTNSKHDLPVAENLLERNFHSTRANQKCVQDITYLATEEGWLYLAVVIDLYSRQLVGWSMSERMKATLVCDALMMALFRRAMPRGVIVHSDRGSQYCAHRFQRLLSKHDLLCSMSKRGDCYDNACAESFFHSLKVEPTHGERYPSREQARQAVFEYIETYYNPIRRHSALGRISPAAFEVQNAA
jgi:transposase InsO family protein